MKYVTKLLKKITSKETNNKFGLGDLLIASFNIVRKRANKLRHTLGSCQDPMTYNITFKNLWRDIAVVQMMRLEKSYYRRVNKIKKVKNEIDHHMSISLLEHVFTPINPWMIDISVEMNQCNDLLENLLNVTKWQKDWPVVGYDLNIT